jgi:hypothetical protein
MKNVKNRITYSVPVIPQGAGYGGCADPSKCNHPYFNKWEGEYICMDCWKKLERPVCCTSNYFFARFCASLLDTPDSSDFERISLETKLESITPTDPIPCFLFDDDAKVTSIGKMSQNRGISIGFLLAFTEKYDCWKWTSWEIIRKIIKPSTEAHRCR